MTPTTLTAKDLKNTLTDITSYNESLMPNGTIKHEISVKGTPSNYITLMKIGYEVLGVENGSTKLVSRDEFYEVHTLFEDKVLKEAITETRFSIFISKFINN